MKEINVQDIIKDSGLLKIMSIKFAEHLGVPKDKLEIYLEKKVENRLNELGKKMSSGDITPEDFNMSRRLSDVNFDELNDKTIKDE
jgi:hypothetical protein